MMLGGEFRGQAITGGDRGGLGGSRGEGVRRVAAVLTRIGAAVIVVDERTAPWFPAKPPCTAAAAMGGEDGMSTPGSPATFAMDGERAPAPANQCSRDDHAGRERAPPQTYLTLKQSMKVGGGSLAAKR
eukprot:CAMPEP_0175829868 /NCGR_PEP_ID=MMETSP0107_2-20121207/13600_1 /TAXON_ID=195067 ORGANISM="Goniomonas pacifica, Strain CCMP1869" /NCGR_SAMPLE_ID=MMETSP0107_2 /ASSEMBLY_ACC=CAM_ASM_000203 /LENGTH=128 /DNA_ID=CAMNT_0017142747 /DNA_START=497 /DNA_END=885 /DNA_ORIENTATION=+